MTRPLSPEQLTAEASFPDRDLTSAIALHRRLAAAELFLPRLHTRSGEPESIDRQMKMRRVGPITRHCRLDAGEGWTGVPFAHPFQRFLDGQYGAGFPWSAGLKALRQECRRAHSDHWANPAVRGSQCYRLTHLVIREGYAFDRACYELGLIPSKTERVFLRGLRRIEQRLDEIQSRETEVVKSDEGRHDWQAPQHVHRALDGLHREDCPQCRRAAA